MSKWWKGAVLYQIYPRSFYDHNGDGIGDLPGITEKLKYVADLGVEGIWISPFFKSPMADYGYDVSDYRAVDPIFGTLDDFRALLDKAHSLDLKIMMDFVLSHTSREHPWFQESRQRQDNPKTDWYVWADPAPDGGPPNNWQSIFGGPSWFFDFRRGQYYLHNFLKEQPDLNLHNPEVQEALIADMRFWLDMGVDGFRLDATNSHFHNQSLKDNPVNENPVPDFFNVDFITPYTMQHHLYDKNQPENLPFFQKLRTMVDEYDNRALIAEVGGGPQSIKLAAEYTEGTDKLHSAYNFSLISGTEASAGRIRSALEEFFSTTGDSWPSWAFSNHDVVRVASRWHPDKSQYSHDDDLSKMLLALLVCLRGTAFIYQGEELGLPEATLTFDELEDPWGIYLWPKWQGRDGCRTPMPWTNKKYGGFSDVKPWLPVPADHQKMSVAEQDEDDYSTLNFTRRLLHWHKEHEILREAVLNFINTDNDKLLAFTRDDQMLCVFNLSEDDQSFKTDAKITESFSESVDIQDGTINMAAYGFAICTLV